MRLSLICLALLCCAQTVFAQFPFDDTFKNGDISITYTASKSEKKYVLTVAGLGTDVIESKTTDPVAFFYQEVKKDLDKRFGNEALLVPKIFAFAEKFSKKAIKVNTETSKTDRVLDLGTVQVNEYRLGNGSFTYALVDKAGLIGPESILSATSSGIYKFNKEGIGSNATLKDKFAPIYHFIKANQQIKIPLVSVKRDQNTGTDQLYIENSDMSVEYINLTEVQAKDFKGYSAEVTVTSGNGKPESAEEKKAPEAKKNPVRILDPQLIACDGKASVELTAFTYPAAEADSIQIEISTQTAKNLTAIHQQIGLIEFKKSITGHAEIKKLNCADSLIAPSLDIFFARLKEAVKAKKAEKAAEKLLDSANKLMAESRSIINNRIDAIAGEVSYAARIQLQDSVIPLNVTCYDKGQVQGKLVNDYLKLDSLVIRVENNLIYQIDIVGNFNGKPVQTVSNNNYGLALRELIDWPSSISFSVDGKPYNICYRNLVFVRPADGEAINYSIADGVYTLVPKKKESILLLQKPLLDFVSASVFLDLQAFNENNANKNLLTELYFNFNINNHRWHIQKLTWFRQLYTNITLATNIFKESNSLNTFRNRELVTRDSLRIDTATQPPFYRYDSLFNNKYYLKHFDLVRHSFFQVKPALTVLSIDYKEARTFFEFNTGLMLMGSTLRKVDPEMGRDSIKSTPVFSYSPLYELRARISPKPRFGIDMHLVYVPKLRLLSDVYQSITGPYSAETLVKAKMTNENKTGFIQGELNFFFNPRSNPSPTDRGGLYFKLNMFKATRKPDGYFMFLIGYSTDIKNFFK